MRQESVLDADHGDGVELQALRRVQGHERDAPLLRVDRIGIGDERHALEPEPQRLAERRLRGERGQRPLVVRNARKISLGRIVVRQAVVRRGGDEFLEVRHAVALLDRRMVVDAVETARLEHLAHEAREIAGNALVERAREVADHHDESLDRLRGLARHDPGAGRLRKRRDQRQAVRGRVRLDLAHGHIADPARGHIHDAAKRNLVARIGADAQVGDRILDLLAVVERGAARDRRRDHAAAQRVLDHARERVHAVEHRHRPPRHAFARALLEELGDLVGLLVLVVRLQDAHGKPVSKPRREVLVLAATVVRDQAGGRRDDVRGRSEVLAERDDLRSREVLLELEDVRDVRAAPAVDRLVRVAHDEDVARLRGKRCRDHELRVVRVLVLVDEHPLVPRLQRPEHLGVVLQQERDLQQQIIEIHGIRAGQHRFVGRVRLRDRARPEVVGAREVRGAVEQPVLRVGDLGEHARGRPLRAREPRLLDRGLDRVLLVARVVDREARLQATAVAEPPQDRGAVRVEGRDDEPCARAVLARDELRHAFAHLARSLVRECEREDLPGRHPVRDQRRDAPRDDAGLSRARACEHERGARMVRCSLALRGREITEEFGVRLRVVSAAVFVVMRCAREVRHGSDPTGNGGARRKARRSRTTARLVRKLRRLSLA